MDSEGSGRMDSAVSAGRSLSNALVDPKPSSWKQKQRSDRKKRRQRASRVYTAGRWGKRGKQVKDDGQNQWEEAEGGGRVRNTAGGDTAGGGGGDTARGGEGGTTSSSHKSEKPSRSKSRSKSKSKSKTATSRRTARAVATDHDPSRGRHRPPERVNNSVVVPKSFSRGSSHSKGMGRAGGGGGGGGGSVASSSMFHVEGGSDCEPGAIEFAGAASRIYGMADVAGVHSGVGGAGGTSWTKGASEMEPSSGA